MLAAASKWCCVKCFQHKWLAEHVRHQSKKMGACSFCGSGRVSLVDPSQLTEVFHNVENLYQVGGGETLFDMMQEDWAIFSEKLLASNKAAALLEEILNADWEKDCGYPLYDRGELYSHYAPMGMLESWDEFCYEVRHDPNASPNFGELFEEDVHRYGTDLKAGMILYRARRGYASEEESGRKRPHTGAEIGAPPDGRRVAGRVNLEGQAVLYCSETARTAVAEVRPATGLCVSVVRVSLNSQLRVLDLGGDIEEPNPFTEESLSYWVEFSSLMRAFAFELARPLERDDVASDYLPCQKVAEWIRTAGFHGIRYPSALNPGGTNIVLFEPGFGDMTESKLVKITDLSIEYEEAEP